MRGGGEEGAAVRHRPPRPPLPTQAYGLLYPAHLCAFLSDWFAKSVLTVWDEKWLVYLRTSGSLVNSNYCPIIRATSINYVGFISGEAVTIFFVFIFILDRG